jgi:hypothetical protein
MKNAVFWDVAPCRSFVNRRFGGIYRLHLQGRKIRERGTNVSRCSLQPPAHAGSSLADFYTLKMRPILSSETSVYKKSARHHIPEDGSLQINSITTIQSPSVLRITPISAGTKREFITESKRPRYVEIKNVNYDAFRIYYTKLCFSCS